MKNNNEIFNLIIFSLIFGSLLIINLNLSNIYKELRRLNSRPGVETIANQIQQQTEFFKGNEIK